MFSLLLLKDCLRVVVDFRVDLFVGSPDIEMSTFTTAPEEASSDVKTSLAVDVCTVVSC